MIVPSVKKMIIERFATKNIILRSLCSLNKKMSSFYGCRDMSLQTVSKKWSIGITREWSIKIKGIFGALLLSLEISYLNCEFRVIIWAKMISQKNILSTKWSPGIKNVLFLDHQLLYVYKYTCFHYCSIMINKYVWCHGAYLIIFDWVKLIIWD